MSKNSSSAKKWNSDQLCNQNTAFFINKKKNKKIIYCLIIEKF